MPDKLNVQVAAAMSIPRVGWNDSWGCIVDALQGIPLHRFTGVFWGQCLQRVLGDLMVAKDAPDWVIVIDYDSMFTGQHLHDLLYRLARRPDIDALAAMQRRRTDDVPLMAIRGQTSVAVEGQPVKVSSAHFGLTVLRMTALADVPKPWFRSVPNEEGEWGENRLDDDIYFWRQWEAAGKTVFVEPNVRIGHLQVMVDEYDENFQPRTVYVSDWQRNGGANVREGV